jgi:hypothetical protein
LLYERTKKQTEERENGDQQIDIDIAPREEEIEEKGNYMVGWR